VLRVSVRRVLAQTRPLPGAIVRYVTAQRQRGQVWNGDGENESCQEERQSVKHAVL